MPTAFTGQLRTNEIFSALFNMIISQQVFADNLGKHQTLVDSARVDGSLYGDTKLYYSTDVLSSAPWGNDAEATNLLRLYRPEAPECQAISIDQFRQISLTIDNYLSKRAWSTEGAFNSFNSVLLGWIGETKKVYDGTTYNVYIGTTKSTIGGQAREIDLTGATDSKQRAMLIANDLANLMVEMGDYSRDFNDYGFLRSYADSDIKIVWNSKYVNEIRKIDLPTIFHKDGLVDKFDEDILPARYFGDVTASEVLKASNDGSYRSTIEADYATGTGAVCVHVFPGDLIPKNTSKVLTTSNGTGANIGKYIAESVSTGIAKGEAYKENAKIICKVLVVLPPYMSAFQVGTSFFNPKSLTENHYLTWGHNTISYLENYPFITISEKSE